MTTTAIRKKIHQYVDEAEGNVLEGIYRILKHYAGDETILTAKQKQELDKTLSDHKSGKLKYYSVKQAQDMVYGKSKR